MRYIVICKDQSTFTTNWYEYEKHYNGDTIYCVIDTYNDKVTFDGDNWKDIDYDHL